jgi:hypothetical protein
MAKQTFTTGQVLTAAQMTSLQETAMGGGPATAKTANYVLVAADAGTTVAMDAAGATTITVNTGLFAAGDTVFIQNLGAGACTVTAGTATVATAGSLILPQNDAGILYFTSPSAAIFYDYIQVGAASPLTTKGDIYVYGTSDTRLGVGANGTTLVADSAETTGLKWATPTAAGANWSLLNAGGTNLTGATTVTVSGISGKDKLMIVVDGASANASAVISVRFNGDTGNNYTFGAQPAFGVTPPSAGSIVAGYDRIVLGDLANNAASTLRGWFEISGCNAAGLKVGNFSASGTDPGTGQTGSSSFALYSGTSVISSVSIVSSSGNLDAGKVYIYQSA